MNLTLPLLLWLQEKKIAKHKQELQEVSWGDRMTHDCYCKSLVLFGGTYADVGRASEKAKVIRASSDATPTPPALHTLPLSGERETPFARGDCFSHHAKSYRTIKFVWNKVLSHVKPLPAASVRGHLAG